MSGASSSGGRRGARRGRPGLPARASLAALARNVLLWLVPAWAVWALLTPSYNRFLLRGTERLLHATESPDRTALYPHPGSYHDAYIARLDFPPARRLVRALRVTDVHFPLVLTAALFLGVPRAPWRERVAALLWAVVATVAFDVMALFFEVKATYATRLGALSLALHGPWARNVYGLAAHLCGLPLKLALPFALWSGFALRWVVGEGSGSRAAGGEMRGTVGGR